MQTKAHTSRIIADCILLPRLSHHVTQQDVLHLIKVCSISDVFTGAAAEAEPEVVFSVQHWRRCERSSSGAGAEEGIGWQEREVMAPPIVQSVQKCKSTGETLFFPQCLSMIGPGSHL